MRRLPWHMRRAALLTVALLSPVLVAGCGEDDSDFDPPRASKIEVFRSNLSAQCQDAKQEQKDLQPPVGGDSQKLAAYLRKVIALEEDLRQRLQSFDAPAQLAAGLRKALMEGERVGDTLSAYERAARGGRDFDTVLAQLETELNPQIRRANRAFGAINIPGCQVDELDLGFS